MLLAESLVREPFENEAFEQRLIEIIAFILFYRQLVVVDLRTELPGRAWLDCGSISEIEKRTCGLQSKSVE